MIEWKREDVRDVLSIINEASIKGMQAERVSELKQKVIDLLPKEMKETKKG